MKAWVLAILVGAMVASVACAQLTPRSVAMGSTGVGVADDAAAWFQNPAGLGALNIKCTPNQRLAVDMMAGAIRMSEENGGGITASGWNPATHVGVGAGYGDINDTGRDYGVGVGASYKDSPFSYGLSYDRVHPFGDGWFDILNVGFMYRFEQPGKDPLRVGLLLRDVTNDTDNGPFVDLGIAWPVTNGLLFAADFRDLTTQIDFEVNGGLEYKFGANHGWVARAGLHDTLTDTNLCAGLGFRFNPDWRIDTAWEDNSSENTWLISGAYTY